MALRALLSAVVERSPWYRERLQGVDIDALSDTDIAKLPVMTKTDLMDNFDAIVTDGRLNRRLCEDHLDRSPGDHLLGEFQVVASGGSSGQRGVYVYGWDAWTICYASNVRFQAREWSHDPTLATVPRIVAVVAASSPTHISAALTKTFLLGETHGTSSGEPAAGRDRGGPEQAAANGADGLQVASAATGSGSPGRATRYRPAPGHRHL